MPRWVDHNDSAIVDVNRFEGKEWTKREGSYIDKGHRGEIDLPIPEEKFSRREIRGGSDCDGARRGAAAERIKTSSSTSGIIGLVIGSPATVSLAYASPGSLSIPLRVHHTLCLFTLGSFNLA